MKVSLVSKTLPNLEYFRRQLEKIGEDPLKAESLGAEQLMIYIARVSSDREDKTEDYEGLLRFLIDNAHWSPFQMADMTVEIETSRAIGRQLIRHRSFTFQEFSQRYSSDIDFENIEFRLEPDENRQSSSEAVGWATRKSVDSNWYSRGSDHETMAAQMDAITALDEIEKAYEALIEAGIASETARMILPECTSTTLYMKGSVRSWIHYLDLRLGHGTQKEHRRVAQEVLPIFREEFPVTADAMDL